jgi:hypothetical protein
MAYRRSLSVLNIRAEGNVMSSESHDLLRSHGVEAERARIDEGKAVIEECMAWRRDNTILSFGDGILALSENDEELLAHMESGNAELQTAAICALVNIRHVLHPRLIEICTEYIASGEYTSIRSSCILYLMWGKGGGYDDQIWNALRSSARRIEESSMSRDDAMILRHIRWVLCLFDGIEPDFPRSEETG